MNNSQTASLVHSINFREHIRQFNSSLAFASFGASIEAGCVRGRGPYNFRVQGITYHLSSNLQGPRNETKKFAQLYFVDSNVANQIWIINNKDCNPNLIVIEFDQILRNINGYSKSFKSLHELEKEETDKCLQTGEKPKNYSIHLV